MEFYLADDDDDQTDEERSVVNNLLKGYQQKSFVPVNQLEKEGPIFDLVVANILAPILIHLAPTLASHLKPGGRIALSGLVVRQADTVIAKYQELFEDVKLEQIEEDWGLVTGTRK
jgi:ribosomal protein L11 methylase PrmA